MRTNLQNPSANKVENNHEYRRRFRSRGRRPRFERPPWTEVDEPTLSENEERDGLEIRFPEKPSDSVIKELNGADWRWSGWSGCWYTKRNERNRAFAEQLIKSLKQSPPVGIPAEINPIMD